jgi:tetratricopeptide (TPR) repeat protein
LVPIFNQITATVLWENGRNDEAIAILKTSPPAFVPRLYLPRVYASMGRYSAAADTLLDTPSGDYLPGALEEAIRLLRTAPAHAASPKTIVSAGALGFVYLYVGAPDRALDFFEGLAEAGYPALGNAPSFLWAPSYAPLRKTERFKAYVRKVGMLDYWRQRGWPDLCRPQGADDFVCD